MMNATTLTPSAPSAMGAFNKSSRHTRRRSSVWSNENEMLLMDLSFGFADQKSIAPDF